MVVGYSWRLFNSLFMEKSELALEIFGGFCKVKLNFVHHEGVVMMGRADI